MGHSFQRKTRCLYSTYVFKKVKTYDGKQVKPRKWTAPDGRFPRYNKETLQRLENDNRITCGVDGTFTPQVKSFLKEVKQGITPGSLWKYDDVGHTHFANEELASILGKGIFDNPKPTKLIKRMIHLSTEPRNEDIILDFFSIPPIILSIASKKSCFSTFFLFFLAAIRADSLHTFAMSAPEKPGV